MPVIGFLLQAVANVLDIALTLYMWIVIARAVLSWVSPDPFNPVVRFIHAVTEPVLYPIRSKIPVSFGGIDFSPIIVFLAIIFLKNFVVNSLLYMAAGLR